MSDALYYFLAESESFEVAPLLCSAVFSTTLHFVRQGKKKEAAGLEPERRGAEQAHS